MFICLFLKDMAEQMKTGMTNDAWLLPVYGRDTSPQNLAFRSAEFHFLDLEEFFGNVKYFLWEEKETNRQIFMEVVTEYQSTSYV